MSASGALSKPAARPSDLARDWTRNLRPAHASKHRPISRWCPSRVRKRGRTGSFHRGVPSLRYRAPARHPLAATRRGAQRRSTGARGSPTAALRAPGSSVTPGARGRGSPIRRLTDRDPRRSACRRERHPFRTIHVAQPRGSIRLHRPWIGKTSHGCGRRTSRRPPRLRQALGRQGPRTARRGARNRRGAGHR
jgi:hypothetical protein